jgi:SAM-dependent methyltransferase
MPDREDLLAMYGTHYAFEVNRDPATHDTKEPGRVLEWLKALGTGTFVDFGCGKGALLRMAEELGWKAAGVEFDAAVVEEVKARTTAQVFVADDPRLEPSMADVLHLGDVIEHLTDLNDRMPSILRLLKRGGVLLAQGPLEGNHNLFNWALRVVRPFTRLRRTNMPPYHVILATVQGQWELFRRFGLETVEREVRESSSPAPTTLSPGHLREPRAVALFLLRQASRRVSSMHPTRLGNRYFYVGRRAS